MLTHTKLRPHECDFCKKTFAREFDLITHFRIHLGEQPYGCAKCEKLFTASSNRNKHILIHHTEQSKQQSELQCQIPKTIVHD